MEVILNTCWVKLETNLHLCLELEMNEEILDNVVLSYIVAMGNIDVISNKSHC